MSACGDDDKPASDAVDAADTAVDTTPDTGADTTADTTMDIADTAVDTMQDLHDDEVQTHVDPLGFAIRTPQTRTVPTDIGGTREATDVDTVCKVVVDGLDGYVYVRGDAVSCRDFGGCVYAASAAWLKVGDDITPLVGATYDFGGNHHNDWLSFPNGAHTLKLYHSSFGFGFRACHPIDCAQIYVGTTLETDGCTTERTLPVTCVNIEADGSEPPLVDDFEKCPGDPNL